MRHKKIILIICSMIFLVGCKTNSGQDLKTGKVEILFSAASSLTDVLEEQVVEYNKINPNMIINLTFAGSGTLQSQIENGAPVDIFMPASEKHMNSLKEHGYMMEDSIKDILKNQVVLVTSSNSNIKIDKFEDLIHKGIKNIGIGNPEYVPVGEYAKSIFDNINITKDIEEKLILANDVRTVLNWVVNEEVDCGIVYTTDLHKLDNVKVLAKAPENSHNSIIYPIGIIRDSKHKEEAKEFIEFLATDKAKEIFQSYGFINAE